VVHLPNEFDLFVCEAGRHAESLPESGLLRRTEKNDILFVAPLTQPAAYYDQIVREWAIKNYVRVAFILVTVVLVMVSLIHIARETPPGQHRLSSRI
jgi:hypothetical protein